MTTDSYPAGVRAECEAIAARAMEFDGRGVLTIRRPEDGHCRVCGCDECGHYIDCRADMLVRDVRRLLGIVSEQGRVIEAAMEMLVWKDSLAQTALDVLPNGKIRATLIDVPNKPVSRLFDDADAAQEWLDEMWLDEMWRPIKERAEKQYRETIAARAKGEQQG